MQYHRQNEHQQVESKCGRRGDVNYQKNLVESLYDEIADKIAKRKLQYELVDDKVSSVKSQILGIQEERTECKRQYRDEILEVELLNKKLECKITDILSKYKTKARDVSKEDMEIYRDAIKTSFEHKPAIELQSSFAFAKLVQLCRHVHFLTMYTNQLFILSNQSTRAIQIIEEEILRQTHDMNVSQSTMLNKFTLLQNDIIALSQQLTSPWISANQQQATNMEEQEKIILLRIRDECYRNNKVNISELIDDVLMETAPVSTITNDSTSICSISTSSSSNDEYDDIDDEDDDDSDEEESENEEDRSQGSCDFDDIDINDSHSIDDDNMYIREETSCSIPLQNTNNQINAAIPDKTDSWFTKVIIKPITSRMSNESQQQKQDSNAEKNEKIKEKIKICMDELNS
jgi:hypothetical protein